MIFDDDDTSLSQSLVIFVAGVGVGLGLGILFAPNSGRKTRTLIAKTADRSLDQLRDKTEDLLDSASDLLDKGVKTARAHKANVAQGINTIKKTYQDVVG